MPKKRVQFNHFRSRHSNNIG